MSPRPAHRVRGRWLVFLAALSWGTSATFARSLFRDHDVPALVAVEARVFVATVLLGSWLVLRRRAALRVPRAEVGRLLVLGLVGVTLVQATYYYSIAHLGVGLAVLLQYLAPAWIVLWDLMRGRPQPRALLLAVLLALGGTALLVRDVGSAAGASPVDWVVGIGSSVVFAFYVLFSKHSLRRLAPETVLFWSFAVATAFWCVVLPPRQVIEAASAPGVATGFLVLGVFSTLVPFALFYAGLRDLPSSEAGVIATSEPVIGIVTAALVLGETLATMQFVGAALVIVAALLASRAHPETAEAGVERG